jgi:two-component system nitrate/nitrite response regulator NarL
MPRLLIADDHPLIQDGLRMLLGRLPQSEPLNIDAASDGTALWQACTHNTFDLVLLDLHMPGFAELGGLDAYLVQHAPRQPTALFSGHITETVWHQFRESGGRGVLHKSTPGPVLIGALQLLLAGERYFPTLPLSTSEPQDQDANDKLTPRQREIYRLILQGASNKVIARQLNLSLGTVKNHVHDIFETLGVASRYQVLSQGLKNG